MLQVPGKEHWEWRAHVEAELAGGTLTPADHEFIYTTIEEAISASARPPAIAATESTDVEMQESQG